MHLTGFQMSAFGGKRTSLRNAHMSAFDPKQTFRMFFADVPTQLMPETKAANEKSERLRSA
jgi:hypothetical protein